MTDKNPSAVAISVVIPMYNAEKFIGACLQSILAQTFQNFEVIVVDDCSTDNSVAVVESFIPKFDERLKLYHMKKNSGCPGAPTNKGIALACGKYIFVPDDDDLILDNALEIFYNFAENFQADVVCSETILGFTVDVEKPFPRPENVYILQRNFSGKPTLETENIAERMEKFLNKKFSFPAWNKLVRRDLLTENKIFFPNIRIYQDMIWTLQIIYFSKRLLLIPDAVYVHRKNPNSITNKQRSDIDFLSFCLTASVEGIQILDNFLSKQKFFQENPEYHCELLNFFEMIFIKLIEQNTFNSQPHEVYKALCESFSEKFGEHGNLIAYLCASSNFSKLCWIRANQRANELEKYLNGRN